MPDGVMTEKELDLAKKALSAASAEGDDKGSGGGAKDGGEGDKTAAGPKDKGASGEGDKNKAAGEGDKGRSEGKPEDKKPAARSVLDDLDDDDEDEAPPAKQDEGKKSGSEGDDKPGEDGKGKGKGEGDDKSADTAWRDGLADHLLKDQGDKLTAAKLAKAREKIIKELQRYKTPQDYMAAGFSARQKLSSGEYRAAHPGADASEDELAAWRKQNDVPEAPEKYEIPKVEGYAWTDADQPVIASFQKAAHKTGLSQRQVNELAKWQAESIKAENARMEEELATVDREDSETAADDLRNRFGVSEFKPRMRAMDRLLKDDELLPDARGDKVRSARYYDPETGAWRKLINDPYFAALLAQHAEYEYGDVGYTPSQEVAKFKGRIAELEEMRTKNYDDFMRPGKDGKSPSDELLELQIKEEERAARRGRRPAA